MRIKEEAVSAEGEEGRFGLGLGIDLVWGARVGFDRFDSETTGRPAGSGGAPTGVLRRYLERNSDNFAYMFCSFQPRDYGPMRADRYAGAYASLFEAFGSEKPRALHHTMLNLGAIDHYDRTAVVQLTNALHELFKFEWVVEDLGIWSLGGRSLPYPLPPLLTSEGKRACIEGVSDAHGALSAPLLVEFPGITEGGTFVFGTEDAFEFFADVIFTSGANCTLDIGHLLAWQWTVGRSGPRMFEGLASLPLERAREFHLSGCQIVNGRFRDLHHGVLLDEQIALVEHLLPLCPNLRGITYEDPVFDDSGTLVPKARKNFERLRAITNEWCS